MKRGEKWGWNGGRRWPESAGKGVGRWSETARTAYCIGKGVTSPSKGGDVTMSFHTKRGGGERLCHASARDWLRQDGGAHMKFLNLKERRKDRCTGEKI